MTIVRLPTKGRVASLDRVGDATGIGDGGLAAEETTPGGHGMHLTGPNGALVGLALGGVRAEISHDEYPSFGPVAGG